MDKLRFLLNRFGERLWVKPLAIGILSIVAVYMARLIDQSGLLAFVPEINAESIQTLLTIMSSSMLVIAVFAVGSMLAAYESASSTATPRSFVLVIADDVSQNALSSFVGAFIFSIVALIALMNGYFENDGRFALFVITLLVFAYVVVSFLRWVDCIARLGRMGTTIDKVECEVEKTLQRRRQAPTLGGCVASGQSQGLPLYAEAIGYIQQIDVAALQAAAEAAECFIEVAMLPGNFTLPGQPLAYITSKGKLLSEDLDFKALTAVFRIGKQRTFDDDPRFGLVVLSEIACRALSPAVNDPGTAISIIGSLVRLLAPWGQAARDAEETDCEFDRVAIPVLSIEDMFEDAFSGIARDGAGCIEVAIRLQKALSALATTGDGQLHAAASHSAALVFAHAEQALRLHSEIETLSAVNSKTKADINAVSG